MTETKGTKGGKAENREALIGRVAVVWCRGKGKRCYPTARGCCGNEGLGRTRGGCLEMFCLVTEVEPSRFGNLYCKIIGNGSENYGHCPFRKSDLRFKLTEKEQRRLSFLALSGKVGD